MRKTIITALLSLAAVAAGAQTLSEALNYSGNNYYGTARSIALGNAMTALGGDLGSVGINPAGSAVAPYSDRISRVPPYSFIIYIYLSNTGLSPSLAVLSKTFS